VIVASQLEVTLRRGYSATYEIELRFTRTDDLGDVYTRGVLDPAFDGSKLPPVGDGAEYGLAIGRALLFDDKIRKGIDESTAAAGNGDFRVRLHVHPDAAPLYGIAWETARDERYPGDERELLFAGSRRIFSRYITSNDIRPLYRRRPGSSLKVLLAVASPSDIATFAPDGEALARIDEAIEVTRMQVALTGLGITDVLQSSSAPVTLNSIVAKLEEDYDVLMLVCHGTLNERGRSVLFLQQEDGTTYPDAGDEFARRLGELRARPRLVVLASCQSAGGAPGSKYGANGALAALGPRLAEAGIPAILAMQGNVTVETINDFLPAFFKQLAIDGGIDRSISMARSALRATHGDWWVPTLLMRLRTGELFRRTGFEGGEQFQYWQEIVAAIANAKCTPIIGPALLEQHVGSRRELATRMAKEYRVPIPRGERDMLSLLAQQLTTTRGAAGVRRKMLVLFTEMVAERFRAVLPAEFATPLPPNASSMMLQERVHNILDFAAERCGPSESHAILARLPFPLYVTANPDFELERAILRETARGALPVSDVLRWNADMDGTPSIYDSEKDYEPSETRPLVYHFFGSAAYAESLVISQDHFIDALIAASRTDAVPSAVRAALCRRSLLFLGFQPDDWAFRTLFRFILKQEGAAKLRSFEHVAVQVDPEESEFDDPENARRYLAQYLGDERIRIYWGSVTDFLAELDTQFNAPVAATA
jgi:hypothetical protein